MILSSLVMAFVVTIVITEHASIYDSESDIMLYALVFVAGMVAPYVAWYVYGIVHDHVYMPLWREPRNRQYWQKQEETERVKRERGECTCNTTFPNEYHLPSCPKRDNCSKEG